MSKSSIHLYYKNVTSQAIGQEHGISGEQFDALAEKITPLIARLNQQRTEGKIHYRDLPYNEKFPKDAKTLAADLRGGM